jgi:hypothetical protein
MRALRDFGCALHRVVFRLLPMLVAIAELCFVCRHVFNVAVLAGFCRLASVRRGGARCGLRGWVRCPVRSPV